MVAIKRFPFKFRLFEGLKREKRTVFLLLILPLVLIPSQQGQAISLYPVVEEIPTVQADSTFLRKKLVFHQSSSWVVNPFPDTPFQTYFPLDTIRISRGLFDIEYDDFKRWVKIASDWSFITFNETVNGRFLKVPFTAPMDWYLQQQFVQNQLTNFYNEFQKETREEKKQRGRQSLEVIGIETGAGRVSLRVRGNVNISGKMVFQDQDLARASYRESQTTHIEFDQRQNLNIEGKIGDRISVLMDEDSEREFDWENNIRIHYIGKEDEIVQKIEAGNISLSLPSTRYVSFSGSNKGLFGLKSVMKFGPVDVTSIASIERTQKEKKKFTGGSETSGQTISDYQYRKNQYFFVDQAFRDGGVIWNDNKTASRSIWSFYPLVNGKHIIDSAGVVINEIEVYKSVGALAGSGTYFGKAYVDPVKDGDVWQERNPDHEDETEGSFFQRLVRNIDYIVSEDLGYIRLTTPLQNEILAVTYTLSLRNVQSDSIFRHEGELSSGLSEGDTLHLKLIRPSTPNPNHPTWDLMFKNVYYLGATNINTEGFTLSIEYKNGALGNDEWDENGNMFIKLFGLDQFDENSNIGTDDLVDRMHINMVTGELFFPFLHPFEMDTIEEAGGEYFGEGNINNALQPILPDSASMYRSSNSQQIRNESQFDIIAEYTNKSATINLGGFMLVEGSEEVRLNGSLLQKGKDYVIDYFTGTLTFLTDAYDEPGAEIEVYYEKHELVSFDKKTILGSRAQIDIGKNSFIGGTALYYNQSVINEKIEVGYEPTRNFIWDLNGKYNADVNFITQALDWLPLIETNKPSTFSIEGEIARVHPNPNPVSNPSTGDANGVAYIDDFEGAKRVTSPSVNRRFWHRSSVPVPLGYKQKDRATMFWYSPYTQIRTKDIWPEKQTGVRAQNELTDILELNYTRRQAGNVNPDSNWAAITTSFYSSDYNQSQNKFFEIWLLGNKGKMFVDLGFISEDQNGNNAFDTEDKPEAGLLTGNTLLEDEEDVGLDGCIDEYENGFGGCVPEGYTYSTAPDSVKYTGTDVDTSDPNGDNWYYNENANENPSKYEHINGTEGNGTADRPLEGARYPDTEDINRDGQFDVRNDYFTVSFDLDEDSTDWDQYKGGETETGWRLYRIPLSLFEKVKGNDASITWDTIKFMRLGLIGIDSTAHIKIAKIELVGNEWQELGVRSRQTEEYVRDDSVFAVTVVNNEDNEDYSMPPGVTQEEDKIYDLLLKEQSLVLKFTDLDSKHEGAARKTLMELRGNKAQSYVSYNKMKLFVYGRDNDAGSSVFNSDSSNVELILRFGRSEDYYEIRKPIYEGWDEKKNRNAVNIDLNFLTGLKRYDDASEFDLLAPNDTFIVTDSTWEYIETSPTEEGVDTVRRYLIHGEPALNRIQYFDVGVKNKNTTESISGEVWLDELRLSDVRKDIGTAMRVNTSIRFADLGNVSINYSQNDADFHTLQERLGTSNTSKKLKIDTKFNVDKLLPDSWGLKVPISANYTNNITTPKYLPGTDILLDKENAPDSALTTLNQISLTTSFGKSTKSDRWFTRYTLDGIKVNFSGSHSWSSNEQTAGSFKKNYSGSASYNLSFGRDNYLSPLKWLKGVPWLGKKIGNTHLYYTPSSFDVSIRASETQTENTPRRGDFTSTYNLGLSRTFKVVYKVSENLNTNYNKTMKSDMDQFRGYKKLDAIKQLNPGIVSDVTENFITTYNPAIFDWLKPSMNYTANYRWSKPLESTQEGANITSQTKISSSVTVSPKSIIETLYTPSKKSRGAGGRRRGGGSTSKTDEKPQKDGDKPNGGALTNFLEIIHSGASKINPISISYSVNRTRNTNGVLGIPDISYRFGLRDELGIDQSDEVGVNRGSTTYKRDLSVRSGLNITRRITTTFNFSSNRSENVGGNNIRTSSLNQDFFPLGVKGDEGLPFASWSIRWSGVENWSLFKTFAKSASLEHAFSGKETKSWQDNQELGYALVDSLALQSSKYTKSFSPLIGLSMTLLKGINISTRFSYIKTFDNRFGGINSTKVKEDKTITGSASYSHRGGLSIPIFFFRDFNLDNTINVTLTFDWTESITRERNQEGVKLAKTGEQKSWKISPRISYSFTRRVTGGIWYEYRESKSELVGQKIDRDFGFDVNIAIQG